ncbi:RNA-guided endonuclease InsQ/TnpB family protein [Streptomyces sp. NPDC059985]|uniref:RNA-guided endonuclease InsQ/TnpB family protein n=1 Tax=Streptomyces sp. NPDC059985 TaxID=3347025 RepID=UPI0036CE3F48
MQTEILRAYRFALDPTPTQVEVLQRHAGAARWAFNHALGMKRAAHERWWHEVQQLVATGTAQAEARKKVRIPIPSKPAIQKHLNQIKGDSRTGGLPKNTHGPEQPCPWWHEVNTYAFQSAFTDADRAWTNWLASLTGKRAGRKVGYPLFKKKGRSRDAFRIHHDVKQPGIRLATHRRLRLPTIGEVRLHDSAKRLARLIGREQAVIQSVTVSRGGHRWYASVLCRVTTTLPTTPNHRQATAGTVGVDLGVKHLAVLSTPLTADNPDSAFIKNPHHIRTAEKRLRKAQQALARTQKGSARHHKAGQRVGRLHHEVAERRATAIHHVTKRLATGFATIAVEDLNVAGMTASARGTRYDPGHKVRQKAGLNRSILDVAPGEFRRQLAYKTLWYGSTLAVLDRWYPSSRTCSNCGWQNPRLTLSDRTFHCDNCTLVIDRDLNAARNIAQHAAPPTPQLAPGKEERQNARRAQVSPDSHQAARHKAEKREDTGPHGPGATPAEQPAGVPKPHQEQAKLF